ncbi:MAG: YSIRK-type signal peptide-containing protein [Ligilactobacillus animalis]|uniref:Rib/alpha-like domain-containing protein n=1 Tax=Ligilactobacillus animalis TaxID=1605 RepID=UPI00242C696E|nr:Rib/alpha-like domain-containing protein [Ligilactobacillus animalis]MCI5942467.1 YSIRK-type signal peptide-containing protein [Ligilactobacillus animalis]MDY2992136.1 Rib/alpha-like domain-containing protein [Ligilactobacillus animalis]
MLSKNNHQLQAQKLEAKQQHFAIKKLTIGVASVLISSTFAMYAGSHTAMAAETAPQSDTASEKTDSNKQNMKKEVVLNSAKPETTKETPAKAPAKPTAEVSSAESATTTAKATQTEHSQVESQPQAKPATAASSSAVVSKPQENTNVQPQSKPAVTTTPAVSAPKVAENTVARPAQTAPAQTAPTQATPAVQAQKSPQWQADATKAVDNKTGLYTPQLSYNAKWYSMSVDPGMLTPDVMKGNSIPFTAVNHRGNITAILSADYKFRIQLDDRLVDKVADISISPADTVNEVVHFKRVYNDAQKPTNIWEANVVYKQGGVFGGLFTSAGKATMARNGKIMLNDTLDNIYPKLPNVAKSPLVYNAYVYDNSSRTALLSTNNEGYIVGPNDPLAKVPVTSDFGGKFMGANSTVSYDPTVGKNGALIVYYQAEKSNMWSYDSDWKFKLHYAIDPALLPYIEKNNGAYTVELDKAADGWGADGSYGFEQVTDPKSGKPLWKRTAYLSRLEHKVADLPLNLDGTGVFDPTNMADYVQFNNAVSIAGRPVMVRLVYHLNKKPEDIYTDMLKKGTAGGNLLFSQYYGDSSDTMQNYSLATSMLTFNDSDGDTLPDLKEESVFTNPHVSMPNVSNAYGTENKVHGQLVFSNVEKNTQHVTVEDKTGKVLGETDVQPVRFNGLAKALPFEVELTGNALAANSNLVVRVLSKLDGNGESTENEEPQETALKVKVGPVAASGFTYPLNAVFLQDPKELITNVKELPANATYTFVKKPDLSTSGMKNAVVKVSFPDQYDPSYLHEMEVNVPVKVEDVDLKAGKFTLKSLVMHVNEVNDDMRPLPVEELQSWQETDGKKTLSGDPLWSLVKSVTWSQSPSTKHAGTAQGVVTVTTKDDKTTLANVPVNIIGAIAKQGVKTPWGTSVTAKDMIANTTELAQFGKVTPLTYTWKTPLNVTPAESEDHVVHNTVVVDYGDKTMQEVPVTVTVGPSLASKFKAPLDQVTVHYGQVLDPATVLTSEQKAQAKVSKVAFATPVTTTTLGDRQVATILTFVDGSTASVSLPVQVLGATARTGVKTAWNVLPAAQTLVDNVSALAKYTPTYAWQQQPNVTPGKNQTHVVSGVVNVTYPDKVVQAVPVTLEVGSSQATVFDEATTGKIVPVVVNHGATVATTDALQALTPESRKQFSVTQATFTTPVETKTDGTKNVPATLTFADTSTTTVAVPVKVVGATVKSPVETEWGKVPDAASVVADPAELQPLGATYSWGLAPATTPSAKEDHKVMGQLLVTYRDGAKQMLPVTVTVKKSAGEEFVVAKDHLVLQPVTVNYGATVTADAANKALTPTEKANLKVANVNFKNAVDTLTVGDSLQPVQVSFTDGSTLEMSVPVKVVGAVAKQGLSTPWGTKVAAKQLVANADDLAQFGSKDHPVMYQWLSEPVVTPAKEQSHTVSGVVTVTYGDGAKQQLPVSFAVEPSAAEKLMENTRQVYVPLTVNYGAKVDPAQALSEVSAETQQQLKLATAKFTVPVQTTELGTKDYPATLSFTDGSNMTAQLPVKVVGAQVKPVVKTTWGVLPDASTVVSDPTELTKFGPTYTWKVSPVTTPTPEQSHQTTGTLQVTFADGAKQEVPVSLTIAPSMAEVAAKVLQTQLVEEDLNTNVPATDAAKGLTAETKQKYSVTAASFDQVVDTSKVGEKDYTATVSFADGSTTKLPLTVKVVSQAEKYAPVAKQDLTAKVSEVLEPAKLLDPSVSLPTGTKASWKTPVDTTKAGHQTGEVEVTYPDGSNDLVPVAVKVGTDAQAVTPKAKSDLKVALDSKLTPEAALDPSVTLPTGTKVNWKTPVDTTKAGHQTGEVEVAYPDGSKDEVPVPVKVGTDAQATMPKAKVDLKVALGGKLLPEEVLDPSVTMPAGTKLSWKTPVDTTKAGHQTGELEVTYPDGSKDEVSVPVKVGTDAQALAPKAKSNLEVALGSKLAPETALDPSVVLPTGTKVNWKTPVDTTKAGHQTGEVEVTYPDGSKVEVSVPVKVGTDAQAVTPKAKANLAVALGSKLTPEEVLEPSVALPTGTKLNWKDPVNTTKAGYQTGELEVTYPDGSKDLVKVPVKVGTDAQATTPMVKADLKVALGGKLLPDETLDPSVTLPTGTKLNWKTPVDTTKAGHQTGELEVTYPDGSKDLVKVPVKVGTDAQAVTPKAKANLEVALDSKLTPEATLDPSVVLPTGAKVSWKTPVDTTKAGHQMGELKVTYPDSSKDEVSVPVKVGTDAQAVTPKAKANLEVALDSKLAPEATLDPSVVLPAGAKVSWKTPVDTTKAGHQTGKLEVTYPDGSKDLVKVPVKVGTDAQAVMPKVKTNLKVDLGTKLAPEATLDSNVTLPAGTKVSWKTPVDTTKAGHQTGELEVSYPDGSKDEVSVSVKVGTDAQAVTPKVKANLEVALNSKLAPETALDPSVVLPTGAKVTWKTPVDTTKAGHQTGELEVSYPDGSKDEVSVPVKVGTDAQATTPKAKADLKVALGGKLLPEEVLDPSVTMPVGTKVSWKTPVNTTKAGHQTGELEVTYPDGSKDLVKVSVKVGTDAQALTPKAKVNLEVSLGSKLTPEEVLDPSVTLPTGTKVSWKTSVDTTKAGHQTGELEVTYPDGSKDVVKVPVKVGTDDEALTPVAKNDLEVKLGSKLTPEEVLDPSVALPAGTKLNWKVPVDTTKAGHQTGELEVTYPDGSKDLVKVSVKVGTDAQAVTPKAKTNLEVSLGSKLTPEEVLDPSVTLPTGTKVSWKTPVDTTKAGHQTGELEVTYPDGSKDLVKVPVKVGTDGQAMTPKAKANLEVSLGSKLTPEEVLDSSVALPAGTKLNWKTPVDTTKAGHQTGELEVTYPDGSQDLVKVSVKVGTDAQALTPKAKVNLEVSLGSKLTPEEVLDPSVALPAGTKLNWKVPVDTTKAGHQTGELEVTYPDGSKDLVKVQVKVGTDAQATTPKAKTNLEVSLGSKLTPEEVLDPSVALPAGTKLNWKTPVDTTKAGHQTGELEVTYPDGSQDLVKVSVKVGTDADLNDLLAKAGVVVKLHEKVAPQQLLVATDKLPKGTQFVWAKAVDADVTGNQTGEVKVVYPDKSSDVVDVTVKVQSVADQFTPTAVKDLVVTKGTKLVLTNLVTGMLPDGSQLNWKVPVDTEKLGMQLGKLEVVYADGSKDQVSVPVKVVDVTKSAKVTHEADHPQAKAVKKVVSTHQVGHKQHADATVGNTKQVLPQTGENTSKNTSLVGLVLLMLLGLFNFGVGYDKKKH